MTHSTHRRRALAGGDLAGDALPAVALTTAADVGRARVTRQEIPGDTTAEPGPLPVDGTTQYRPVTATVHALPHHHR
jgi:hypothetical protein